MLSYNVTGRNGALSAHQFIKPTDQYYAWNRVVWDAITMGGPIDAPDTIAAGSSSNAYLDKCASFNRE